jgi:hypothetical protein
VKNFDSIPSVDRLIFCAFCSLPAMVWRLPDDGWLFRGYS